MESNNFEAKAIDEFVLSREKTKEKLIACQKEYGYSSCLQCDKILDCELRKEYVKKVYDSMSKGKSGGFEF